MIPFPRPPSALYSTTLLQHRHPHESLTRISVFVGICIGSMAFLPLVAWVQWMGDDLHNVCSLGARIRFMYLYIRHLDGHFMIYRTSSLPCVLYLHLPTVMLKFFLPKIQFPMFGSIAFQ